MEAQRRICDLALWSGEIVVSPLKGGLSNESWHVRDGAGSHVVRFGEDFPFHHVSREREAIAAQAAAAAGLAPEVRHVAPGLMVTRFLGARTFTAADVRSNLNSIATLVRRFHEVMPRHVSGPGYMFWVFHVIRDYARLLDAGGSRMRGSLHGYLALAEEMERAQVPLPIVFGHNDLLPANILDTGDRLWLIDFEYAGFGTAMFDLAGLSSNAGFGRDESEMLLAAYFGAPPTPALKRSLAAMQVASLLREAMWSMVSERHLRTPGVDFEAYTAENLGRLATALEDYRSIHGKDS